MDLSGLGDLPVTCVAELHLFSTNSLNCPDLGA